MHWFLFILQAAPEGGAGGDGAAQQPGGGMNFLLIMGLFMVVWIFFMSRGQKKKTAKRDEMLSSIKKNDVVWVFGGIKGWVHSIKDREIVLKLDTKENTKLTVLKEAITHIGDLEKEEEGAAK
jgi:preprotein translocase subunit YajC